jgi:hypothetical protein
MNKAFYYNTFLLGLCFSPLKAQESSNELPSMAFLEYLAEMTEIDGKLYGPQDIPVEGCNKDGFKQDENKDGSSRGHDVQAPNNKSSILEQECISND